MKLSSLKILPFVFCIGLFSISRPNNTTTAQTKEAKAASIKVSYQNVVVRCSSRMKLKNVSCVPFKHKSGDEYVYTSVEGVIIVYNKTTGGVHSENCEFIDGQFSTSCR